MCMFMGPARVARTKLFATRQAERQVLVYEARVDSAAPNAMMLPVPVAAHDSRIELINLEAYPLFFEALYAQYIIPNFSAPSQAAALEVFRVGAYEASIVPSIQDMSRIDGRFRLSEQLLAALAERYADHAFVVYQFAAGRQQLHPFAFSFTSRYDKHLFFPTLHVHDGEGVPDAADFDHEFAAQGARLDSRLLPHGPPPPMNTHPGFGFEALPTFPNVNQLPDFVDQRAPLDMGTREGRFRNEDILAALFG